MSIKIVILHTELRQKEREFLKADKNGYSPYRYWHSPQQLDLHPGGLQVSSPNHKVSSQNVSQSERLCERFKIKTKT